MDIAYFITDFADQAVILPLALSIAVILYASGWRRGALAWCTIVVGTLGVMFVLKLGFGACGHLVLGGEIISPSGHAAAAGVIYGSLVGFMVERAFNQRLATLLFILVIVIGVAGSRVMIGAHTVPEAALGAAIGTLAAVLMLKVAGRPADQRPLVWIVPATLILAMLLHGTHSQVEQGIRRFSIRVYPLNLCRSST